MKESDYWLYMEFRVSDEFAQMAEPHLRFRWCDGFTPQSYHLEGPQPRITGLAWICDGPKQEKWEFTLFLNTPVTSPEEIDWAAHLPAKDTTRWLAVDLVGKRIQFEPSAAVSDGPG